MTAWMSNMMMSVNSSKSWQVVEALVPNFPKTTPTTMQKNRIPEAQSPINIRHHQGGSREGTWGAQQPPIVS